MYVYIYACMYAYMIMYSTVFHHRAHVSMSSLTNSGSAAAVGCRTLPAPQNGWHARTGSDVMVVGCNATRERWYLHCDGRRWIGEWRNCTAHGPTVTGENINNYI